MAYLAIFLLFPIFVENKQSFRGPLVCAHLLEECVSLGGHWKVEHLTRLTLL